MLRRGATRNEIQRHDEDSNQPMQKYRCSYKALHGVSIRKNVSCGSFLQYGCRIVLLLIVPVVHISHKFKSRDFHFQFSCTSRKNPINK